MTENELLYFFPYQVDKQNNFRFYANKHDDFVRQFVPNYDGTNIQEFLEQKSNLSDSEKYNFLYQLENYSHWNNWFEYGKNVFAFSKDLLSMLEKTDVSEITPEYFKLPYDIFYISLRPLNIKISKHGNEIIEGVYIDHNIWNSNGEHLEGYCDLSFYFVGDFKRLFLEYVPKVKSRIPYTINSVEKYDESPLGSFWSVWLWFEKNEGRENVKQAVDYFLQGLRDEIFPKNDNEAEVSDFDLDFYNSTVELISNTINLVINCLLYLSQPPDKIDIETKYPQNLPQNFDKKLKFAKTPKEHTKIDKKLEQLGFTKIKYVGQSFRRNNQSLFSNLTLQPHWRRGHWRNQKFGEKLKNQKIIWIMPTIVNYEKGIPKKGHIYDINEKNNDPLKTAHTP